MSDRRIAFTNFGPPAPTLYFFASRVREISVFCHSRMCAWDSSCCVLRPWVSRNGDSFARTTGSSRKKSNKLQKFGETEIQGQLLLLLGYQGPPRHLLGAGRGHNLGHRQPQTGLPPIVLALLLDDACNEHQRRLNLGPVKLLGKQVGRIRGSVDRYWRPQPSWLMAAMAVACPARPAHNVGSPILGCRCSLVMLL